jgi:hypothetical protein
MYVYLLITTQWRFLVVVRNAIVGITFRLDREEMVKMNTLQVRSFHKPSLKLKQKTKQTPWPLVRERTIPTERPPLVDEI